MGVDKSEAYDGLVGQTYELKTMLHAIHSAGTGLATTAIYRTRGIYAWAAEGATPPELAGHAVHETDSGCLHGRLHRLRVRPGPCDRHWLPAAQPVPPDLSAVVQRLRGLPRGGFEILPIPDQDKAVATTLDAGRPTRERAHTVWKNQLDDALQGASAAACTSCHQTTDAQGSCVPEWLDAADLRERTSDHYRYEVS